MSGVLNKGRRLTGHLKGTSKLFLGRGIYNFLRNIGKVGFEIAENGMSNAHGTRDALIFLFGKRERYEIIA